MNIMLIVKNKMCDDCVYEELCEEDSIMACEKCQEFDLIIDDISWRHWNEMSYRRYTEGLLDFNWDEYADGE